MNRIDLPDAEAMAIGLLKAALPGVRVSTSLPNPRVSKMVRVSRIGGPRLSILMDKAQLLLECYATSSVDAHRLACDAHEVIYAARNSTVIGSARIKATDPTGPVNFPDPDAPDMERYQFTASLNVRLAG